MGLGMRGSVEDRGSLRGRLALATAALLASGCLAPPPRLLPQTVEVDPAAAAYLAASICRDHWPGADPLPEHAGVPIVRTARGFRVCYRAVKTAGPRVACNGRLAPPQPPPIGAATELRGCHFEPAPVTTARGTLLGTVELRSIDHGRAVRLAVYGAPGEDPELATRLADALHAAAALAGSARKLSAGDTRAAERLARTALQRCDRHGGRTLATLRARLHYQLAAVAARRGDLLTTRSALQLALAAADSRPARAWLVRIAPRLASKAPEATPASALARAAEYLRADDLAAAANWARRAVRERDDAAPHALLAEVFMRRGAHQEALEENLLALEIGGFDPRLVARCAACYAATGNAPAGLRLLRRHESALQAGPNRSLLRELLAEVPPDLAERILRIDQGDPVALHAAWE